MFKELGSRVKTLDFHEVCVRLATSVVIASGTAKFIYHELASLFSFLGIHLK
jgi:hypothetical protein